MFSLFLFFLPTLFASVALAQSIVNPTTAVSGAAPVPTINAYTYAGCYNETTGDPSGGNVRAVSGGNTTASNSLTAQQCVDLCAKGNSQYAGLEYGRECYCGSFLSTLSQKLDESACNYACNGNASTICGGSLTLTIYNMTGHSKTGAAWRLQDAGSGMWFGAAAGATLVIAALL